MNEILQLNPRGILPHEKDVLGYQGIPKNVTAPERIRGLFSEAIDVFLRSAEPAVIVSDVSIGEFEKLIHGEGRNAPDVLLQQIFPHAECLALFALTLGQTVSMRIEELFDEYDYAKGSMLDAVASSAAEVAIETCETLFADDISKRDISLGNLCVLNYSPGYCGWDIRGQKAIFQRLRPQRIGMSLNASSLMSPIKSVTGVLVAGRKEIHMFKEGNYSYCSVCNDRTCVSRMRKVLNAQFDGSPRAE